MKHYPTVESIGRCKWCGRKLYPARNMHVKYEVQGAIYTRQRDGVKIGRARCTVGGVQRKHEPENASVTS